MGEDAKLEPGRDGFESMKAQNREICITQWTDVEEHSDEICGFEG